MSGNTSDRGRKAVAPRQSSADAKRGHLDERKAGIRSALAEIKDGQTVPAEDVEAWIESWDKPEELPMPEPRRR
jgi:predicted transcriptional regulator